MSTNFNQTVNLRKKNSSPEKREEDFYDSYEEKKENLKKISKPQVKQVNEGFAKRATVMLAVILIMFTAYWMFGKTNSGGESDVEVKNNWYKIELVNGKIYYGQISDTSANPVVITNVYYDYDQDNGDDEEIDETDNIKLVKRGKETYGPSGTMYIYQVQIGEINELSQDSKVLGAILEYEK